MTGSVTPLAVEPALGSARPLAGALLTVTGGWLLVRQVVTLGGSSLALVIGAVLVASWLRTRRPTLLVTGAPLVGAATGLVVGGLTPPGSQVTLLLAGLAAGYGSAALAHRWTVAPAMGAAALALATSGLELTRAVSPSTATVALGAAATGLGAVLVLRPQAPRAVVVTTSTLVVVGVTALAAIAQAAVAGATATGGADPLRTTAAIALPELDGRRLVVLAPRATTVLRNGPTAAEATVQRTAGHAGAAASAAEVVEHDDRVEVRAATLPGARVSLTLTIPPGVRTSIVGGSGDVLADVGGRSLEIDTTSGAISASLSIDDGDEVVVRSDTGDVDVRVIGSPRLTAEAPVLLVDGYGEPHTGLAHFSRPTGAGALTVVTRSGRAAVVAVARRPS